MLENYLFALLPFWAWYPFTNLRSHFFRPSQTRRILMEEHSLLFSVESMLDIHPLENFKILFDNLKTDHLHSAAVSGRKPFSRQSLLKAIIFKNLSGLSSLSDLAIALKNNPSAAIRCGLNILKPLPSVERYSEFLRTTENTALQKILIQLAHELIRLGVIRGNYFSIDPCPIIAKVKENNLKTNVKDRFNKERILKGDPDAPLIDRDPKVKLVGLSMEGIWAFPGHLSPPLPGIRSGWDVEKGPWTILLWSPPSEWPALPGLPSQMHLSQ
jgi:hypothetical protein